MAKTLLLADDSVTIQKVVGITFANEDVELVTVDNGDEALVRARQIKPDLVLADIGMPGLDGYSLCAAIRKEPSLSRTPVLLLTGTFETYDEERAREVGANGYISKPFEAQALVDRVFSMLAQSAAVPTPSPSETATRITPLQPEPARAQPVAPPMARTVAPARPSAPPTPASRTPPPTTPAARPPAPTAPAAPPRLELPPVPGAISAKPARPSKPRPAEPFEFEVTPEERPTAAAAAEPLWEAEPQLEARDDSPMRRAMLEAELEPLLEPEPSEAPAEATRLFAPDLLGRSARLPEIPEPPAPKRAARGDFSFEDLDFEEPTASKASVSQVFGESSDRFGDEASLEAPPSLPADEPMRDLAAPLADPLYSQTRFLDPHLNDDSAPSFGAPRSEAIPELPDLLGSEAITEPSHALDELELSEIEPELEAIPLEEADALDAPDLSLASAPEPALARADAATRLRMPEPAPAEFDTDVDLDADLLEAEALAAEPDPEPAPRAPAPRAAPTAMPAVATARAPMAAPVIDSALLSQTLEKVAWEAFGSLSEQVVNEVRKRVEAVVWEVVPQLCERLIREEIARLKADLPE